MHIERIMIRTLDMMRFEKPTALSKERTCVHHNG